MLLCMLLANTHKKCLTQSGMFLFPWMDSHDSSTIQYSSCVAVQYNTGTKFFHRVVPKLHATKHNAKIVFSTYIIYVQTDDNTDLSR